MRFLIVDDSRAIQTIIRRILENTGYKEIELKTAMNGEEALATLETWQPDLMLTDWHMPGMTGLELLQTIRQMGLDIKVGFITTETSARHIEEAHRNGDAFVINKPFTKEILEQAVLSVLQDGDGAEAAIQATATPHSAPTSAKAVGAEAISQLLSLSSIICKVDTIEPIPIDRIKLPYVISLYGSPGSKSVEAICLMDLYAACMLGGAMTSMPAAQIKNAIASKTLNKEMYENCSSFLRDMSGIISASREKPLTFTSSHLVQKPFAKLYELMGNNYGRTDFGVSFSAYGDGFITILLS